ncbi:hsp70 nucleotide exchange factor fes1 [Tulasnella sp. 425]|nr:hsp70 nucleotide exchange factor fes1 [Tulasnella sp. 425]
MASEQGQTSPDNPDYAPPRPLEELDPGLIDTILGKPNAVQMRDAMAIAIDESESEQERRAALDDMELLILMESLADSRNGVTIHVELEPLSLPILTIISVLDLDMELLKLVIESQDNADDMEVLKLWEPVLNLTTSPIPTISSQALKVVGTAIEKNPKSQKSKSTFDAREKALYVLSRTLRHNREAVVKFTEAQGWKALKAALEDPHIAVRQKNGFPPERAPPTRRHPSLLPALTTSNPTQNRSAGTSTKGNPRPITKRKPYE